MVDTIVKQPKPARERVENMIYRYFLLLTLEAAKENLEPFVEHRARVLEMEKNSFSMTTLLPCIISSILHGI
jgi:hypothetical protein